MKKVNEIILHLQSIYQMFMSPNSLFWPKRMLNPDIEEFLSEEAAMLPYHATIYLKLFLPPDAANRAHEIESGIHQHFAYRKEKSEKQLKQTLKLGWRSLLISIIFLSLLISFTTFAAKLLPEGGLSVTFREILVILGWVALWRPADLLLYEWRPFKREANLFNRLEQCQVQIVSEAD